MTIETLQAENAELQAEVERLKAQANTGQHMLEVARANGFRDLTDAICQALTLNKHLAASEAKCERLAGIVRVQLNRELSKLSADSRSADLAEIEFLRKALAVPSGEALREVAGRFQIEQWSWVQATFPGETAEGAYRHLKEEINELGADLADPAELADCFLLIQCLASHAGVDLMEAARAKFEVCKARKWVKTEAGYRHAKQNSQTRRSLEGKEGA